MKPMYKSALLSLCLVLGACGNKGDLYRAPLELTDEQKALLDDLDAKNDEQKAKKKKANSSDTPNSE